MPTYHSDLGPTRHRFADLRALLAAASPARSGDMLAGIAATSAEQRVAARYALADRPTDVMGSRTILRDLLGRIAPD